MHDAFLKSVFADPRMVEILVRRHAPEWASEVAFSTLRAESTGLVSRKTLQQHHPDMIWSADTRDGGRVLFLLEFQRTVERLMALRTTTYTALALEGIAAGPDFRRGDSLPEFVYFVLYHGDRPWTAPARAADLFQRSDPTRYRLVPWSGGEGDDRWPGDLAALTLGLARRLPPEDMAAQLAALRLAVEESRDAGLEAFMFDRVDTVLELRGYYEKLKLGGATTMAEMIDRLQQDLDELVQRGARQGRRQGRAMLLRRQITRRFGEETAGKLSELLDGLPDPEGIDRVTDALIECGTGEEFVERVRMA